MIQFVFDEAIFRIIPKKIFDRGHTKKLDTASAEIARVMTSIGMQVDMNRICDTIETALFYRDKLNIAVGVIIDVLRRFIDDALGVHVRRRRSFDARKHAREYTFR